MRTRIVVAAATLAGAFLAEVTRRRRTRPDVWEEATRSPHSATTG